MKLSGKTASVLNLMSGGSGCWISEMIRDYGEPPGQPDRPGTNPTPSPNTSPDTLALLDELRGVRVELVVLRQEVAELRLTCPWANNLTP